jgi:short-subunit dehydrogenase
MKQEVKKTAIITGSSRGIGKETAIRSHIKCKFWCWQGGF